MSTKQQIAQETRQRLLQAAGKIVIEQGATRLTLDAVTQEAGVSKGGLLYHFPSKERLITGLLDSFLADFETITDQALTAETDSPEGTAGRKIGAYVRASVEEDPDEMNLSAGLLAAVAANPALLDSWRVYYAAWQEKITSDGIDPILATIIRLAADGLWIGELFQIAPLEPELRAAVVERLLALSRGESI